ncbi:MAG: exodeoxyribonuclease V subunit gamma [Methylosarcina sp.]
MFILHSSNKTENLLAHLCAVIENAPLSSPFAKEVFLIQSQGMERWLSQQLASRFEVFANFEFLFPARFFSDLAQKISLSLSDSAFDRHLMLWRIESLLRRLEEPEFEPLKHYLTGDNASLKRYQLARQLAQIFDQYQIMRPDMLAEWQQGRRFYHTEAEPWQMRLWMQITQVIGDRHRGALWLDVIAHLNEAENDAYSELLPERIFVFGLNTLPPLFLSYLQGLARHCQLHLFLLNPAETYWADLSGKKQRILEENPLGHPLLSALGQQGREFQEMLLEQAQFDFEPASFELSQARNALQQLQNDILNNSVERRSLKQDGSITIHSCHSRMREVEVLHDQLLMALEQDATLELREIVVMAPDIEVYEPFISAVFHDIQHAVADRSLRLTNHALDAFIIFLNLSQSRFGWQSVLDLLDRPLVYSGFGLTETDLDLIKHWIRETRVRWGKSAQHKKEFGLPELSENTWQAALDRLLMGYAMGSDAEFIDGVMPYPEIEGSSAQALGGLYDFLRLLFEAGGDFKQAKTLAAWSERLFYYAEQLLPAADPVELRELYEVLAVISDDIAPMHHDDVELSVVTAWLEGIMTERKSTTGFLRGQLTFCSMLPMRSIPFRVIALLGMNEGEFPKIERHPTFDLLSQHFRKGDRSRRADDRYQFLEILLSVRERLMMTFVGQSLSGNENIPPSVAVSELLDVLEQSYGVTGLITRHPLQSFSHRYYDGATELFSFSEPGLETAKALSARSRQPLVSSEGWWQQGKESQEERELMDVIELNELLGFFQHPQRHFMRRKLDLYFNGIETRAEEREPFAIDRLEGYAIDHDCIVEKLSGREVSLEKMQAQGRWLPGTIGNLEFERQRQALNPFIERIKAIQSGSTLIDLPVDLRIQDCRLVGKLGHRYEQVCLMYRYAELKGKDLLRALLHHLIINRLEPRTTVLLSIDDQLILTPGMGEADLLVELLDVFRQGLNRPDAFFVEPALAYVKQAYKLKNGGRSSKSPLEVAREQLMHAVQQPYEPELRRLYGHMADPGRILADDFERRCQDLLLPIWEATHD